MVKGVSIVFAGLLGAAAIVSACSNNSATPQKAPSCGFPPPVPMTNFTLAVPSPGATNVPDNLSTLIFEGSPWNFFGPPQVTLASGAGSSAPLTVFSPVPSPPPTPLTGGSYVSATIAPLTSHTAYTVNYTYWDFSSNYPICKAQTTISLGTFTTQ